MAVNFQCQQCGHSYKVKDELAGRKVRCKICKASLEVPSESAIYRHRDRPRDFELAIGDSEAIEVLGAHISQHLGEVTNVLHEIVSDLVHIDIHVIPPGEDRDYLTLVTTGMSDRAMTVPDGAEEFRYAELLLQLPADWPMQQSDWEDEQNYWPIRWLKILARFPHEYSTWLGIGHTVPNGDPPQPFAENTGFVCWLLSPVLIGDDDFQRCEISPDKSVQFLSLLPLYAEETTHKLSKGLDSLLGRFDKHQIGPVLDLHRKNVCAPRWKLW